MLQHVFLNVLHDSLNMKTKKVHISVESGEFIKFKGN